MGKVNLSIVAYEVLSPSAAKQSVSVANMYRLLACVAL